MMLSLITSQIDTAPKPTLMLNLGHLGLITSQIDTAPKPRQAQPVEAALFDYQSD